MRQTVGLLYCWTVGRRKRPPVGQSARLGARDAEPGTDGTANDARHAKVRFGHLRLSVSICGFSSGNASDRRTVVLLDGGTAEKAACWAVSASRSSGCGTRNGRDRERREAREGEAWASASICVHLRILFGECVRPSDCCIVGRWDGGKGRLLGSQRVSELGMRNPERTGPRTTRGTRR